DWTFDHKIARTAPWKGERKPELTLRPGESVVFEREGGSTYINNINDHAAPRIPHSRAVFMMEIASASSESSLLKLSSGESGFYKQDVITPYPIVSATLNYEIETSAEGTIAYLKAGPLGHPKVETQTVKEFSDAGKWTESQPLEVQFAEWNQPFARYGFSVVVEATAAAKGSVDFRTLRIETACQYSTTALPNLSHNPWVVSSSPGDKGEIEIEVHSRPIPESLVAPGESAVDRVVSGTEEWIELKWSPPIPEGEPGLSFEVDLSDDPDFRWTLLPYLTYFEDRSKSSFRVPASLFPKEVPFYFRVRKLNQDGLASDWSPTLEFRI
ncbi:MAG: fibronectin type III domain-containing protein, partial [Candidatus Omnitrophica bacterium]|nr:fibronectin type III domain-containing protein [Candidatus Omnitrophota bacterium]